LADHPVYLGSARRVRVPDPDFREILVPVQRFRRKLDRTCAVVRALPVQPLPFPVGPSGVLLPSSPPDLTPSALLSAGYPSPRSRSALQPQPHAQCGCTSPGVSFPFSASRTWRPYIPVASTTIRNRPSPGFLTLSTASPPDSMLGSPTKIPRETFIELPAALLGFPVLRPLGKDLSIPPGRSEKQSPLHGFLLTRDESVLADSPFLRFAATFHERPS